MLIEVRNNDIEKALRIMKKKMQREGFFKVIKQKRFYEKPSEKRVREEAESQKRMRRAVRKKRQTEGF